MDKPNTKKKPLKFANRKIGILNDRQDDSCCAKSALFLKNIVAVECRCRTN